VDGKNQIIGLGKFNIQDKYLIWKRILWKHC